MVKDTGLYNLLPGVAPSAKSKEITEGYYARARMVDSGKMSKNTAKEYQDLLETYVVLIDAVHRERYDRLGKEGIDKKKVADCVAMYNILSGLPQFADFIGASDLQVVGEIKTISREERIVLLKDILNFRLSQLSAVGLNEFEKMVAEEAAQLATSSFGKPMLNVIGYTYERQAARFLGKGKKSLGVFPVGEWFRNEAGIVVTAFWAIGAAMQLFRIHRDLSSRRELLQDETLNKKDFDMALISLWDLKKLEIEIILADACEAVLKDETQACKIRSEKALALEIMSKIFLKHSEDP